ncbi:hypothetical protein DIPPA_17252 [Diplonema papillatum]|nr:hypothetical protein DIPPA_17252 [Diplonema papillatum]
MMTRTSCPGRAGCGVTEDASAERRASIDTFGVWWVSRRYGPTNDSVAFHTATVSGSGVIQSTSLCSPVPTNPIGHATWASDTELHSTALLRNSPPTRTSLPEARADAETRTCAPVVLLLASTSSRSSTSCSGAAAAGAAAAATLSTRATAAGGRCSAAVKFAAPNATSAPRTPPAPRAGLNRSHTGEVPLRESPNRTPSDPRSHVTTSRSNSSRHAVQCSSAGAVSLTVNMNVPRSTADAGRNSTVSPPLVSVVDDTTYRIASHSSGSPTAGRMMGSTLSRSSTPYVATVGASVSDRNQSAPKVTDPRHSAEEGPVCSGTSVRNTLAE